MDNEEFEIVHQGPGYTIAKATIAQTLVPYGAMLSNLGDQNHGFVELRGRSDKVCLVRETQKSKGLAAILSTIACPDSPLMTSGCECDLFDLGSSNERPRYQVGGYVDLMFQEADSNTSLKAHEDLAIHFLNGISGSNDHHIGYEMIIEPL